VVQTHDLRNLPGGYGRGSTTLARWIDWNLDAFEGKEFPRHWGEPPVIQTHDSQRLPGGFGTGSTTLMRWIKLNLDNDKLHNDNSIV
jgi:hypothetical protein